MSQQIYTTGSWKPFPGHERAFLEAWEDFMTWAAESYVTKSSDVRELVDAVAEALKNRGIEPPEPPKDN